MIRLLTLESYTTLCRTNQRQDLGGRIAANICSHYVTLDDNVLKQVQLIGR